MSKQFTAFSFSVLWLNAQCGVMDGLQAAHLDLCLISCQGRTGSTCLDETISGEQEKKTHSSICGGNDVRVVTFKRISTNRENLNCFRKASLQKLTHISFNLMLSHLSDLRLNEIHSHGLRVWNCSEIKLPDVGYSTLPNKDPIRTQSVACRITTTAVCYRNIKTCSLMAIKLLSTCCCPWYLKC